MSNRHDPAGILKDAHELLLSTLLQKLKEKEISHQEMAILRNLLRDNGMVISVSPPPNPPSTHGEPGQRPLPSLDDPEYEDDE